MLGVDIRYTHKVDIWSLGITLYEAAVGTKPYRDEIAPMMMICQIQRQKPAQLPKDQSFSQEFSDFLDKW